MDGYFFQASSLLYIILLAAIYFSKKRLNILENKIYKMMIISNIIGLIFDISLYVLISTNLQEIFISIFLSKIYLVYLFIWSFFFMIYIYIIAFKKGMADEKEKIGYFQSLMRILVLPAIVSVIALCALPINLFNDGVDIYSYGPAVDLMYGISVLFFLSVIGIIVKNFKHLRNFDNNKFIPAIVYLFAAMFVVIVQRINPGMLLSTPMHTFLTFLMFFTIENPDLQMIEQLNVARDQAEKANSAKSEFLSNMSHEIRTPLNAICGFGQSLMEEDISPSAKEEVKYILMASENLLEIVNGILDISKIEANKLEIINTKYNPYDVFDDIISLAKGRLAEKPLDFRISIDPSIPQVLYGDYVRLRQIVINLLTNSIKYTKEGYFELKVSTLRKDNICRLIISVEDSGIGIPEEKIDGLFTKFGRIDLEKNISIEGTGLGLAITKKLIDLMHGKIVVQSEYGKGSRFTVAIDQRIIAEEAPKEINAADMELDDLDFTGKKVLIVDDNKINLKVAMRLLEGYKCDAKAVESGFECLEIINAGEKYDLILMDDMMPKMSGVETFQLLKQIPGFNMPVIALTANAVSGMREKYLEQGFNDYLSKPIARAELNRIMNNFLGRKE